MSPRTAHLPPDDLFPPALPEGIFLRRNLLDDGQQRAVTGEVRAVVAAAPLAQARTKSGGVYSAAMTNCGAAGWWSDEKGYRYTPTYPGTTRPWPPMPDLFRAIVRDALAATPWPTFDPDVCLINYYPAGAKMGLHQDKDEKDFSQPIVTLSLGDAADFMIGGTARRDKAMPVILRSGDVLVFGGPSRLRFHGIRKIYPGTSPVAGIDGRFSLTFRRAL